MACPFLHRAAHPLRLGFGELGLLVNFGGNSMIYYVQARLFEPLNPHRSCRGC